MEIPNLLIVYKIAKMINKVVNYVILQKIVAQNVKKKHKTVYNAIKIMEIAKNVMGIL